MNRRQNAPELLLNHNKSPLQQIKDLQLEIQLKNHEIDDLKFQLTTLKKKQSIWSHLDQTYSKQNSEEERKLLTEENQKLKSQIFTMLHDIDQKNININQLKDKINDLKNYNLELKKINHKIEQIHQKQIDVLKNSFELNPHFTQLKKQNEKLKIALNKCDVITKQMEHYYVNQIENLKHQLNVPKPPPTKLPTETEPPRKHPQLKSPQTKPTETESKWRQSDFSDLVKQQNQQKKVELILGQVREGYEQEIAQLKEQVKFLVLKVETLQDSKNYNEGLTSSILAQSKLAVESLCNNDSFRFTANNSFSSSIKEGLSRKNGPLRTPSKKCRKSNHLGYLLDRTNF